MRLMGSNAFPYQEKLRADDTIETEGSRICVPVDGADHRLLDIGNINFSLETRIRADPNIKRGEFSLVC
jgi:hypothetical protein